MDLPCTHAPYYATSLREDLSWHFGNLEGFLPHIDKMTSFIKMDVSSATHTRTRAVRLYPFPVLCIGLLNVFSYVVCSVAV